LTNGNTMNLNDSVEFYHNQGSIVVSRQAGR
jgi:hypothetical protein